MLTVGAIVASSKLETFRQQLKMLDLADVGYVAKWICWIDNVFLDLYSHANWAHQFNMIVVSFTDAQFCFWELNGEFFEALDNSLIIEVGENVCIVWYYIYEMSVMKMYRENLVTNRYFVLDIMHHS